MAPRIPVFPDDPADGDDRLAEADLWFLPGPMEDAPDDRPPRGAGPDPWRRAEAGLAARLARVAGRMGALDERLRRGPPGWRQRLALIEAADLGWLLGDRIAPDRLAQWVALRLSGVAEDAAALARLGWAVRRLGGGPGPEADLAAFLDRRDAQTAEDPADPLADRAGGWLALMARTDDLHPITRACAGFHQWGAAGLGDRLEAAVTAARIAAGAGGGAVFAPLAMGGAMGRTLGLRAQGTEAARLARWLEGMEAACLTALRHLDDIEGWAARAEAAMAPLSGRTPRALRAVLCEWPLVSAPMAEALTGASRAAVQRNLAWMEGRGLVREVTGQGRFRMWRAV